MPKQAPASESRKAEIKAFCLRAKATAAKAVSASKKAANRMVLRHKAKHPPMSYSVGEKVLVKPSAKDHRVARGGHKLRRITPQQSTVLDVNTTLHQYKVIVDGRKKCMHGLKSWLHWTGLLTSQSGKNRGRRKRLNWKRRVVFPKFDSWKIAIMLIYLWRKRPFGMNCFFLAGNLTKCRVRRFIYLILFQMRKSLSQLLVPYRKQCLILHPTAVTGVSVLVPNHSILTALFIRNILLTSGVKHTSQ